VLSLNPATDPLRVDALRLTMLEPAELARAFQVDARNPLTGLEGRVNLLRSFGEKLLRPDYEDMDPLTRPGELARVALDASRDGVISILEFLASYSIAIPCGRDALSSTVLHSVMSGSSVAPAMKSCAGFRTVPQTDPVVDLFPCRAVDRNWHQDLGSGKIDRTP
jgi:hypothetical protein